MSVRLFALGALCEGDAHGYDLIEKGRAWGLESWADISFSSIYHALRTLAREGLARELPRAAGEGKARRTVYRITPKGRAAFSALMRDAAADPEPAKDPVYLVLGFMRLMGEEERSSLLARRAEALSALAEGARAKISYMEGEGSPDYWSTAAVRLYLGRVEAELAWLRGLSPKGK